MTFVKGKAENGLLKKERGARNVSLSMMGKNRLLVQATDFLHKMGIPAHLCGYYYLRSAVVISLQENNAVSSVTKLLYPEVAKEYVTTEQKVERGIRNAIEVAWKNGDVAFFEKEFGFMGKSRKGRPSNSECIARIVDRIRMEQLQEQQENS